MKRIRVRIGDCYRSCNKYDEWWKSSWIKINSFCILVCIILIYLGMYRGLIVVGGIIVYNIMMGVEAHYLNKEKKSIERVLKEIEREEKNN